LTERNRDVLLQRDHRQFTPFLLAASLGYTDLLEYFLHVLPKSIHHRVDPNKAPDNSLMANDSLILALAKDHLNAAILIMKQANLVEKQTCYTFLSRAPQEILSFLENRLPSYQLNFTLEQSIAEIHQWIKTFKTQLSDHPLEDLKTITQKLVDTHNNLLSYHNITTPMSKLETLLNEALAIMFGNPALTTHFIPNLSGKLIVKKSLFDFFKALEDDIKPYQLTTKIAIVPGT